MLLNPLVRTAARTGARQAAAGHVRRRTTLAARSGPGVPPEVLNKWYNIFGKSTAGYAAWIVGGILVGEFVFGFATDSIWKAKNYGRTYETVDWTKFIVEDDEEEDEDEDDDDDDDDGDDDDDE